jgi:hypothetical protein
METSLPGTALGGQRIGKRSLVQTMLTVLTQTAGDRGRSRRSLGKEVRLRVHVRARDHQCSDVIDAMATGEGSDIAEIRATAPHPEQRRARFGRRSACGTTDPSALGDTAFERALVLPGLPGTPPIGGTPEGKKELVGLTGRVTSRHCASSYSRA